MKVNKIVAILLPIFWFVFIGTADWEYSYIIRFITSTLIGGAVVYTWKYYDFRDLLLSNNEMFMSGECDLCNEHTLDCVYNVKISCD